LERAENSLPLFLFFSVARSAHTSQADRANEAKATEPAVATTTDNSDAMPTDKLLDVTPQALRMSSPFNAGYWLSAA
jgi:hypothetical protein